MNKAQELISEVGEDEDSLDSLAMYKMLKKRIEVKPPGSQSSLWKTLSEDLARLLVELPSGEMKFKNILKEFKKKMF